MTYTDKQNEVDHEQGFRDRGWSVPEDEMDKQDRETTNYKCQDCGQIVHTRKFHPRECCESYKTGIKEALDWIASSQLYPQHEENGTGYCNYRCAACSLDSKVREWGLDEKES